jgi:hypothetical protein
VHQWFQTGHCDIQLQKEKLVILPLFWGARPVAWFAFAKSKFWENTVDISAVAIGSSFGRYVREDPGPDHGRGGERARRFPLDMLKARLLETHTLMPTRR